MAVKRMVSNNIVQTDKFWEMSKDAQLLYFYLIMTADDDGFNSAPMQVMNMCKASTADMEQLVARRFVIWMDSGVMVIRHWLIHNNLKKATYHPTVHTEDKEKLGAAVDGSYELLELLPCGSESLHSLQLKKGEVPLSYTDLVRIGKGVELLTDEVKGDTDDQGEEEMEISSDCLYGPEKNILLLDAEYEKLCETYMQPDKLITKVGYILMNSKSTPSSHYAYIHKIALSDNWPLRKNNNSEEKRMKQELLYEKHCHEEEQEKIAMIMKEEGVDQKKAEELLQQRYDSARDQVLSRLKGVID